MQISHADLDGAVLWTLIRAATQVKRDLGAVFLAHELSPVQFGVLANLTAEPEMTTADLARKVLTRPQSLAGVLDGMVERGLVARAPDRGRGRRNAITVTATGDELLTRVWPDFLAANDLTGHDIDPERQAELNRLLTTLLPH